MNYELKVTITNNKAGKFHYQVIDENGNIISERKSNREYVACTTNGSFYFGRLDLIGKGDHGRLVKWNLEKMNMSEQKFLKLYPRDIYNNEYHETIDEAKKDYQSLSTIAYKK
jgi:hypothetical protein